METKGLFSALYTDRGSHYWNTETGGWPSRHGPADAGASRVAATGDHAHSRLFTGSAGPVGACLPHPARRLPNELAWAGITEMAAASRYLAAQCPPAYHPHFAVPASEARTAFVPWIGTNLTEILCVQEERVVPRATPCGIRGQVCRSHRTHTGSIM